jgi:hypothetical protein
MRCKRCSGDGVEPSIPETLKEVLDNLDNVGNRAEEAPWSVEDEIEALYADADDNAALDALYQTDDDDDDEGDDDWGGEWVSGPFPLSYLEAVVYHYPDGSFDTYDSPDHYYISETGDHLLVVENEEVGIVITSGWRKIERFPHYGEKPFNIK